ncbi:MAG: hypothetical protein LQ340_005177 [Diploschistes diacapsis]|nr:MAG: hypothetical protein LQ340_005177 [Diploschistes diacapsis]
MAKYKPFCLQDARPRHIASRPEICGFAGLWIFQKLKLHDKNGHDNCQVNGGWTWTLCLDGGTCAENCTVESPDYSSYGINVHGSAITLNLYTNNGTSLASPHAYLLANDMTCDVFTPLNREITYNVDLTQVLCGINGALYFSKMPADGGYNACRDAVRGRAIGTTEANFQGYSNYCNEMDLWEANHATTQLTPHPCNCNTSTPYLCQGAACGASGVCDQPGCEYDPFRQGNPGFYGMGANYTINTLLPFTVVTQFVTSDDPATGQLTEIKRYYKQGRKAFANPRSQVGRRNQRHGSGSRASTPPTPPRPGRRAGRSRPPLATRPVLQQEYPNAQVT